MSARGDGGGGSILGAPEVPGEQMPSFSLKSEMKRACAAHFLIIDPEKVMVSSSNI